MTFTFKMARRLALAYTVPFLFVLAQFSCGEPQIAGFVPPADTTVVDLQVTPGVDTTTVAQPVQLRVTGYNAEGDPLPVKVDWSASGGTIDTNGQFLSTTSGTYYARARHKHKATVVDSATVVVVPGAVTLAAVVLSPASVSLNSGATQQFSASGRMSDGSTGTVTVTYSATGGAITTAGLYTAGNTAGTFRVIATQQVGSLADTSSVTVTVPPPTLTRINLTPGTASLQPGASQPFTVSGQWSDGSTTAPAVTFAATGGTITAAGVYTAGATAGSFRVIATQQGGSLADTAAITIAVPPATLTSLTLAPASVTLSTGTTRQFSVSGQWSDGSTTAPAVTYAATGGTITAAGLYTAGTTAGSFRVIATQQGGTLADTSAVTVTAPTLAQVILAPATASLATGGTQQFTVSGRMSDGSTTTPAVTYSATGGTISTGGLYTAGATAGSFRVIATQQGGTLADTSAVTLTAPAPTLAQVILAPATASLATGGTQQFTVTGRMSDGSTTTPAVTYSATGGTISTGGLYTAGPTAGSFRVIATQQGGTLADTSAVTLTAAPPPTLAQVILAPATATVLTGATLQMSVTGRMSDGSTTTPAVTYTATGGIITTGGLYTAGAAAGSFRVIATQQGGTLADTSSITVSLPQVGGGAVFYSDWSTAAGTADNALLDLGKSVHWQGSVASNDPHGILRVVPAAGLGFPASIANVMRVTHPLSGPVYGHMITPAVWPNPQVGETRYFRVYLASWIADDEGNMQGGYTSHHPTEDTQLTGNSAENWQFEYAPWGGGTNNGYITWVFGMLHGPAWPRTRWHPGNGFANLRKFVAYRIEWSFTKTATNTYTLNDLRIYNPAGDATLLYDKNSMYGADGSTLLATNNTGLTMTDAQLNYFWVGTNGGSGVAMTRRDEYTYWGAVCVRSDTWCGPYVVGER